MSDQINYLQRVGHSRCVRCDFETSDAMSFAEQDAALRKHLDEKHPGWLTDGAGQKQVSDLEQRSKEAAAKAPQQWFIQEDGAINTLAETREYASLVSPANILALLAEKDAEIERLTRERDELYAVDAQSQEIVGKYMEDAESAERERDEWKRIAGQYREQDRSESDCDEHVDHQDCDERCDICKAYDALVKGE